MKAAKVCSIAAEETFRSETYEFVLQTDREQLAAKKGWTVNYNVLWNLAEREGFSNVIFGQVPGSPALGHKIYCTTRA